jgi:Pyruvate/2-oxoacid:ferredoxin oxidoreductase delta subunit
MCRFCVEHGDGKKWYLQASSYAAELSADLKRRGYMVGFLRDFDRNRRRALTAAELLDAAPRLIADPLRRRFSRRMQRTHFGQPVPIEECERIFDLATSIVNVPCPCRTFAGGREEGYCLLVTTAPVDDGLLAEAYRGYGSGPDVSAFQRLTKAEGVALLRRCETQGLMHSVWTFLTPFIGAICNCNLDSGCLAMRLTVGHGAKLMWKGESVARVDASACTGCGSCAAICPFKAIDAAVSGVAVRQADCWGCGVCRAACGPGAISLQERPATAGW